MKYTSRNGKMWLAGERQKKSGLRLGRGNARHESWLELVDGEMGRQTVE